MQSMERYKKFDTAAKWSQFKKIQKKYFFLTLSSFGYFEMPKKEPIFLEISKLFFNFKLFLSMSNIQCGSKGSKTIKWQKIHSKPSFQIEKNYQLCYFFPHSQLKKVILIFERKKIWMTLSRQMLFIEKKQANQPFPRKQDALN